MPRRGPRASVEWVGGTAQMPAFIADEGEPWRPEVLMWLSADGAIVGSAVMNPAEILDAACDNLRETIAAPMWGAPHAPTRVRVASPELAAVLRAGFPHIEIVCAPTPELDVVIEGMREHMLATPDDELSWLSPQVDAAAVASFFRAAAALYRARPWDVVPADEGAFFINIPTLDVFDSPAMVIGQLGESFGVMLFDNADDLETFGAAMDAFENGDQPDLPPYLVLNYERGADLQPALRREIAANHWEVASTDAYPSLLAMEPDLVSRSAGARELAVMEAIALALPQVLVDQAALQEAWGGGEPYLRSLVVTGHAGEVEVSFGTEPLEEGTFSPAALLQMLVMLAQEDELDHDMRRGAEMEMLAPFYSEEEGLAFAEARWALSLFEIAANELGFTVPLIEAHDLEALVFETLPGMRVARPGDARAIIAELRAVYRYLRDIAELGQGDECLAVLRGPSAIQRLEVALGGRGGPAPAAGNRIAAGNRPASGKQSPARRGATGKPRGGPR